MDPTNPGFRWPITPSLATYVVGFIDDLAHAIFKALSLSPWRGRMRGPYLVPASKRWQSLVMTWLAIRHRAG